MKRVSGSWQLCSRDPRMQFFSEVKKKVRTAKVWIFFTEVSEELYESMAQQPSKYTSKKNSTDSEFPPPGACRATGGGAK